jgi:hypothetical protein
MVRKLILLSFVLAFFGCQKSNELRNSIELLSVVQSDCKGNKSAMIEENNEMLIVRSTGVNIYTIQHLNVMFNCCLPDGLAVDVVFQNDTIYYTEREKVLGNCRCLCPYDLSSEIGNLEEGEYVLCLIKETNKLGTISLNFQKNMNEEILVSELKDYSYL